jgi:hypothetical protein
VSLLRRRKVGEIWGYEEVQPLTSNNQVAREEWDKITDKTSISKQSSPNDREVASLADGIRPDPRIAAIASRDESRNLINSFKKHKPEVIQEASQLILRDGVLSLMTLAEMCD